MYVLYPPPYRICHVIIKYMLHVCDTYYAHITTYDTNGSDVEPVCCKTYILI